MKYSKAQQEVITLMNEGWELCSSNTMIGGSWLQKNGCGNGGETKRVGTNTFFSLFKRKTIILFKNSFPTSHYRLSKNEKPQSVS